MVKKFSPVIPLLFTAFVLTSFVAIRNQNEVKVLGEKTENLQEDRKEIKEVRVKEVRSKLENVVNNEARNRKVEIRNEDGKVKAKIENKIRELKYEDSGLNLRIKEASSDGDKKDLIEKRIKVSPVEDGKLEIEGEKHDVRTNFPITVDQKANTISVTTPKGEVKVKELPSTAIENLVNNHVFSNVSDSTIEESTNESGEVVMSVNGENDYKFLGLFKVRAKVNAEVDTQTGDLKKLNTPWYIQNFGFLFSK
jgi:hypothetical protein